MSISSIRISAVSCLVLLLPLFALGQTSQPALAGRLEVRLLDDQHLVLVAIYDQYLRDLLNQREGQRLQAITANPKIKDWSKEFHHTYALARVIAEQRPRIAALLQQYSSYRLNGQPLSSGGYFLNSTRQSRLGQSPTGQPYLTNNADVAHFVFLTLPQALTVGQQELQTPTGERISFTYRGNEHLSHLYKFNQLGFSTAAGQKYAYLGAWQGDAGALDLSRFFGQEFRLHEQESGKVAYCGRICKRDHDGIWEQDQVPFCGEMVAELDISPFNQPGRYYFVIDGIGRSRDFLLSADTLGEAFFIHCRGLYHKRCGMAKEAAYTNWPGPACHLQTYRGNFPPNAAHYRKNDQRKHGFFDSKGQSVSIDHFALIRQNTPQPPELLPGLSGGWHDAADYDRRPQHFRVVNDLLAAFLLAEENFSDAQLNIPESGNGIPDIIDEAIWGMRLWLRAQQPNGGVGTWVESTSHPSWLGHDPGQDPGRFYLSLATRESSLEYAAHASMLALVLQKLGRHDDAAPYLQSALRAFQFAHDEQQSIERQYRWKQGSDESIVTYRDNPELPRQYLLKAGFNLFLLTGSHDYLQDVEDDPRRYLPVLNDIGWKYSPWLFVELALFGQQNLRLLKLTSQYDKIILKQATELVEMTEENHSYRQPWHSAGHRFVSHTSWGTCHPLRQAQVLFLAWKNTGNRAFLDAAFLANDWHNGGNPLGLSLTSGLGYCYPVHFLDLPSYTDGIAEFVPGITPYRHTFGIAYNDYKLVHGLFKSPRLDHNFSGQAITLLPLRWSLGKVLDEKQTRTILLQHWPIWRRNVNLEGLSVPASEFSVHETIAPAAALTGCLMSPGWRPGPELLGRRPADRVEDLPGFAPLP
ncbi:MAG: hypothetical protein GX902_13070 [Lentisphaerae bacterium]|nr:hypothetical protein [Lentisphaerota bacterium]